MQSTPFTSGLHYHSIYLCSHSMQNWVAFAFASMGPEAIKKAM